MEDYPSESATEAGGSESEDENAAAAVEEDTSVAYVMSLEQENESLKQINLNLQEVSVTPADACLGALTCNKRLLPQCMPNPANSIV